MRGRVSWLNALFALTSLSVFLLACDLPGIGQMAAPPPPSVDEVVMARRLDEGQKPIEATEAFAPTNVFYCSVRVSNLRPGSQVTARWFYGAEPVHEYTITLEQPGSGYLGFNAAREDNWPPGDDYRVEIYLDGQLVKTIDFTVAGAPVAEVAPTTAEETPRTGPPSPPTKAPVPEETVPATPTPQKTPTATLPAPTTPAPEETEGITVFVFPSPQATPTATPLPEETVIVASPSPAGTPMTVGGGKIAYAEAEVTSYGALIYSIWIMNADGSERRKIANLASDPSFSSDGQRIAFSGYTGRQGGASGGLWIMNADGSDQKLMWNEGSVAYTSWAPDGQRIALLAFKSVIIFDLTNNQRTPVIIGEQPAFSADGQRVICKTCQATRCGLFIVNIDGTNRIPLTIDADDGQPAWSPDGQKIAFASGKRDRWDIHVINADGSGRTRLTDGPGLNVLPAWLGNERIVFRSTRDGSWGIWIMDADGSNQQKLIDSYAGDNWGRARLAATP